MMLANIALSLAMFGLGALHVHEIKRRGVEHPFVSNQNAVGMDIGRLWRRHAESLAHLDG